MGALPAVRGEGAEGFRGASEQWARVCRADGVGEELWTPAGVTTRCPADGSYSRQRRRAAPGVPQFPRALSPCPCVLYQTRPSSVRREVVTLLPRRDGLEPGEVLSSSQERC